VAAGDEVKEGDALLILSAMKMENNILSPRDGVIRKVLIAKGDAIDKGQVLIEFEA
jgi:biotin carboxyl carrier protein